LNKELLGAKNRMIDNSQVRENVKSKIVEERLKVKILKELIRIKELEEREKNL
jgi:hypothetical protein